MADEPENHTLRLLREMRDEAVAFRQEVNTRFDGVDRRLSEVEVTLAAMRADQTRANELLETVAETQKNQGAAQRHRRAFGAYREAYRPR
jgi:hypothetical protein